MLSRSTHRLGIFRLFMIRPRPLCTKSRCEFCNDISTVALQASQAPTRTTSILHSALGLARIWHFHKPLRQLKPPARHGTTPAGASNKFSPWLRSVSSSLFSQPKATRKRDHFRLDGGEIGNSMKKVLPCPAPLVTPARPSWASAIRRTMESPRPIPEAFPPWAADFPTRANSWKSRPWSSTEMPGPWSQTSTRTKAPTCATLTTIGRLESAYLMALVR